MNDQEFRFQVNMGGIIDLFSRHLYSSPRVFVRELLQNAVDAVTARTAQDVSGTPQITVHLVSENVDKPQIRVTDSGTGLTLDEIHRFLSIIGESSKRENFDNLDFIGRFGVGLLSGFLVSDFIELYTKSIKSDQGYLWQANQNGTYTIVEADVETSGSTVVLTCKDGSEEYFDAEMLEELVAFYGDILPYPVYFKINDGAPSHINAVVPPWLTPHFSNTDELIQYGETYFGENFMGCIPLKSSTGGIEGVAYIMDRRVHPGSTATHRVYLRNMLLSENAKKLLPDWAFFLRAVVNAQYLRPTASREDFYEDEILERTRDELGVIIRNYLKHMAEKNSALMDRFIAEHHLALKSLAMEDEEILNTFLDYFPFETSLGTYTFKEIRKMTPVIKFVSKVDQFRQLAPVFAASSRMLVNAGYVYDDELMQAVNYYRGDINLERLNPEDALFEMESLSVDEQNTYFDFIKYANEHLQKWDCVVEVKKYSPVELPALLIMSDSASFAADLRYSKANSTELFADILDQIDKNMVASDTIICFNADNILVKRLIEKNNYDATVLDLLYVQSMLMARRPLKAEEMHALNNGIINLIERSI